MNSKHQRTLRLVFADPIDGAIEWPKIESLLRAIGCRVIEGSGSSVTFERNGLRAYFHRPHPRREALRYRVRDARMFLEKLGIRP